MPLITGHTEFQELAGQVLTSYKSKSSVGGRGGVEAGWRGVRCQSKGLHGEARGHGSSPGQGPWGRMAHVSCVVPC